MLKNSYRYKFSWLVLLLLVLTLGVAACSDTPTNSTTSSPTATSSSQALPTAPIGSIGAGQNPNLPAATTSANPANVNNNSQSDGRTVLTLWTGGWKNNRDYEAFLNKVIDDYRVLHPEVTVDWSDYGDQLTDKFFKATVSGTTPDLILLNSPDLYQFAADDKLEDFNQYISSTDRERYLPAAWDGLRLGSASYGIPWLGTTRVAMINKRLWQQADLDLNKIPKSYAELNFALPNMKDKTPADARAVWVKPDPIADFMMANVSLFKGDGNSKNRAPSLNSPEAQNRWNYFLQKRNDAYFMPEAIDRPLDFGVTEFASNRIVMFLDAGPALSKLRNVNADLYNSNTIVVPDLTDANGLLPLTYQGWAMPKAAKDKYRAADFALSLANGPNQLAFAKLQDLYVPTAKEVLTDPFLSTSDTPLNTARSLIAANLSKTVSVNKSLPAPISFATRDQLIKSLYDAQAQVWSRKDTPASALALVNQKWAELLK